MEEADKKSESENESEIDRNAGAINELKIWQMLMIDEVSRLMRRVKALEEHLISLDHGNEGGNDIRDGGWFD